MPFVLVGGPVTGWPNSPIPRFCFASSTTGAPGWSAVCTGGGAFAWISSFDESL